MLPCSSRTVTPVIAYHYLVSAENGLLFITDGLSTARLNITT